MAEDGVIIIDVGSGSCKVGYSGEDTPRSIFPSVVEHPVLKESQSRMPQSLDPHDTSAHHPLRRGSVTNWDQMEQLLNHTFSQSSYPENGSINGMPVLLTEPPLCDPKDREKIAQLMFETFKAPAVCVANSAVLSLFASGRTRGVVLESGAAVSSAVPIFEGFALPHATLQIHTAGQDVTKHMQDELIKKGYTLDFDIVRDMKEKLAVVTVPNGSGGAAAEGGNVDPAEFELPDGSMITVDTASRTGSAGSLLFDSSPRTTVGGLVAGQSAGAAAEGGGLAALVHKSIIMCDKDLRDDLFSNIVIAGGNTMTPGFLERMKYELVRISQLGTSANLVPDSRGSERGYNSQRKHAAWIGGSMFASLSTFNQVTITKQEWLESDNSSIVHRKCL